MISPSVPPERPASPRLLLLVVALLALLLVPAAPVLAAPGTTPPGAGQGQGKGKAEPKTPPVWAGYPGTNEAHATYGYPWPAAPDCNEAALGGGCVNDGLGFFQGQCTSWVAHRLGQRNGFTFSNWYRGVHWGNASEWAKVAKSVGIKPNRVPAEGSVGWYARGHVSYVEAVNSDGSIVISEMNTDGRNGFHLVTVTPGGVGWPDKFIHFADIVPVDYTAPDSPPALTATTLDRGVQVSWERPSDDLGVTGYRVLRNDVEIATTSTPAFRDLQASPGQAYTYSVTAYDAAGNASDAATTVLRQDAAAPARAGRAFLPGSARLVLFDDRQVVCGRVGSIRHQRVGCRVQTARGTRIVATGRAVQWGSPSSQVFLPGADDRVWFCRSLPARGDAQACVPFDSETRAWGYDRVDRSRATLTDASWVVAATGPARCGMRADRAVCSVVTDRGWRAPRRADNARPGDPLSRAFVATDRGVEFCRVVQGRAACTGLGRQGVWRATVSRGENVAHGRWVARRTGSALCPVGRGTCRPVPTTRA